jgi:hypothetical protein
MKESDFKKTHTPKEVFHNRLLTSLKRALRIGTERRSASDLNVPRKGVSDTFVAYDELRRINDQLLKAERQRAEAIRLFREKRRFL